jgi:uncharacterized protein (TIGR03083 family)
MHPHEHLDWLRESVDWYLAIEANDLSRAVPRCPGWQVDSVFDHLGRGVGIARIAALDAPPDADVFAAMGGALPAPARGAEARSRFAESMPAYLARLAQLDPSSPCATYAGVGSVAFWMRRDAIELALHASDIADALGVPFDVAPERASDAIDETIEFVLPMALQVLARTAPPPCRLLPIDAPERLLGDSTPPRASISGTASSILLALWGRATLPVDGDEATGRAWTGLVEEAFRGPATD